MAHRQANPKQFEIEWRDSGRSPQVKPNPDYPTGKDVDAAGDALDTCTVPLPYPARRVGAYVLECRLCGFRAVSTTAGRPDDPRSIRLPCKTGAHP
jgi:hypothetical protein